MSKEELIQTYPIYHSYTTKDVIVIIVVVLLLAVIFIGVGKHTGEWFRLTYFLVIPLLVLVAYTILYFVPWLNENKYNENKAQWKNEVLSNYLKEQPKEKIPVLEYSQNDKGNINVILETDHASKLIGNITKIEYFTLNSSNDKAYVETSYIESIPEVELEAKYINTTLYLPEL